MLQTAISHARDVCVAEALGLVGASCVHVQHSPEGAPIWPTGTSGSISHKSVLVVVAVTPRWHQPVLGIDVDRYEVDRDGIAPFVAPEGLPTAWPVDFAPSVVHVAKEAVFKAQAPVTGQILGYEDVKLMWEDGHVFRATLTDRAVPELRGSLVHEGTWLGALVHMAQ